MDGKGDELGVVNNHDVSVANNHCDHPNDDVIKDDSNHVAIASCDDVKNSMCDSSKPCDQSDATEPEIGPHGDACARPSPDISSESEMQKSEGASSSPSNSVVSQNDCGVVDETSPRTGSYDAVVDVKPANSPTLTADSEMCDAGDKTVVDDSLNPLCVALPEGPAPSDKNYHHSDSSASSNGSKDVFMDAQEDLSNEAASRQRDVGLKIMQKHNSEEDLGKDSPETADQDEREQRMEEEMERFYQSLTSLRNDALAPSSESTEQKQDEPSTSRAGAAEPDSTNDTENTTSFDVTRRSDSDSDEMPPVYIRARKRVRTRNRASSSSSSSTTEGPDEQGNEAEARKSSSESENEMETENTRIPSPKWHPVLETRRREVGFSNTVPLSYMFARRTNSSLSLVQRLKLQYKLESHDGCVNALHFNKSGTLLASGSDDMNIVLWRWDQSKPYIVFESGHRSNVFQAKFMPYTGDTHIVSCARDGMVRLAELSSTGICKGTRKLAQHKGAAHKLAIQQDASHLFYSCGEDAVTFEVDLRQEKPNKLCTTRGHNDHKVALYSIHANPFRSHEFVVGGRDAHVRVYDKRMLDQNEGKPLKKFCPAHLVNSEHKANVTCAVYNYNGSEIIGTYNDEDIYLFDSSHSDGADFVKRYRGHRNNATVKGVNFYGPHSEYIISGSDCGNIFLWDRETEKIVQFFHGDEGGVINVLEPHPHFPILATSGLDHDVKIWAPTANEPTDLEELTTVTRRNRKERREEQMHEPEMLDGQMLWLLMQHLRRTSRRNARRDGEEVSSSSSNSDDDPDEPDDPDSDNPLPGAGEDGPPVSCVQS